MRRYDFIAWKDEGIWTVHAPSLPGVYGIGDTFAQAKADFLAAVELLSDHLDAIGEPMPRQAATRTGQIEI